LTLFDEEESDRDSWDSRTVTEITYFPIQQHVDVASTMRKNILGVR
jgi:hypothetical protein